METVTETIRIRKYIRKKVPAFGFTPKIALNYLDNTKDLCEHTLKKFLTQNIA